MSISANLVKDLREKTGCGFMDCKAALAEAGGDLEKAAELLRKKGIAAAAKKAHRETGEGLVHAYIHPGSKIGVLIEVNCETDFVARTDDFRSLVHDLAMQVAAARPGYVSSDQVPEAVLAKEREILLEQARGSGKPEHVLEKIVAGRLEKFYEDNCLLDQKFIKDQERPVKDIIHDCVGKLGENIRVRRFQRFQLGEE